MKNLIVVLFGLRIFYLVLLHTISLRFMLYRDDCFLVIDLLMLLCYGFLDPRGASS